MLKALIAKGISLKVQLYSLLIAFSLWIFFAYLFASIDQTRDYLAEQMSVHAQDGATSLGLSISPYMAPENHVIAETMASAIFDAGYYSSIYFRTPDGQIIFNFENPDRVEGVPQWFISLFPLTAPVFKSEVNSGWTIAGTLSVSSHLGTSYQQLWQHAGVLLVRTLTLLVIGGLLVRAVLRFVLAPLQRIEEHAFAVMRKQFKPLKINTVTTEVRSLSSAMNAMTANIQSVLESLTLHAESVAKEAFVDPLTQAGNRRDFDRRFDIFTANFSHDDKGSIALLSLPSLMTINHTSGYQAGDQYVLDALAIVKQRLNTDGNPRYFRISGGSIVVVVSGSPMAHEPAFTDIVNSLTAQRGNRYPDGFASFVFTDLQLSSERSKILATLDGLMTQSESSTGDSSQVATASNKGLQHWKQLIETLCCTDSVKFLYQPMAMADGKGAIYHELFASFYYRNQAVPNSELFAMAERLGLSSHLDKKLLMAAITLNQHADANKLALNLNDHSLNDAEFVVWLELFLAMNRHLLSGFHVEINESALINNRAGVERVITLLKDNEVGVSIDRFGQNMSGFKQLKDLDVDYVKLDGSYSKDLLSSPENKPIIAAVCQIGRSVGVKVIACHVECNESLQQCKAIGVDGMQGNFVQPPHAVKQDTNANANGRLLLPFSNHSLLTN